MSTAFSCHATENTCGRKGHSLMAPDGNRGSFQVAPVTRQSRSIKWIFGIANIPQHAMFLHDLTCSYHKMMPTKWPGLLRSGLKCWQRRPWAAPHRAQWSKSPAESPVTAGALPHFGVCIWVSGNSMIYIMIYMFVLGVRSYKRVWRILEDGDP